ncbi:MAG: transposase [Actinomycetes bacterium]
MRDWLDEGHLAWFVIDVVAKVDTTAFHARHRNDGPGRPAYNPDMMLTLLFYAYGTGMRSSRRIEAACRTDAAFRVICGNGTPDHATIARFLVDHETAIAATFVDVLRLCVAAGLVSPATIAIDGTKIAADAALDRNRGSEWIRAQVEQMLAEAAAIDAAEDAQDGLFGLDSPHCEVSTRAGRLARLEAALARIEAEDAAEEANATAAAANARQAAAEGRKLRGRKPNDPHARLARAEADYAATLTRAETRTAHLAAQNRRAAALGRKPMGHKPGPDRRLEAVAAALEAAQAAAGSVPAPAATPTQANITDPDSRIMKTKDGFVQGYNCQAAVDANQVVVACSVTQQANDLRQYQPMVDATVAALTAAGITEPIGIVLADAGYWSETNATAEGPDRLIATVKDWKQRRAARDLGTTTGPPPATASTLEAMEHRLRTPQGAATYAKRSHTVEPVFADDKHNHGYDTFRRRGLAAAASEWALINISHNLGKLFRHQAATPLAVT